MPGGQAILRTTGCAQEFVSRENEERMTLQELRTTKRDEILNIAARRGARNVRVFCSMARGDDDERSDIDFLVDLEPDRSLFDLSGLLIDLEAALHSHVDVVTERGLRPRIRDRVLREAVLLLRDDRGRLRDVLEVVHNEFTTIFP